MTSVNKDRFKKALDKLVPENSPASLKIHRLITYALSLKPNFALNIEYIPESFDIVFTVNECEDIADAIVKAKKIEEWAVSYMLILFYKKYGEVDSKSHAWQFMSAYLQIILRITMREDKHFAKVNQLGVRLRMGLNAHNPQSEILNQLIHIHNQQNTLACVLDRIRQYETLTKQSETSVKGINKKLAGKIGRIRLAYEVVAEDKLFIGKTYSKTKSKGVTNAGLDKVYFDSDDEPLRAIAFGINHKSDNVSYDENLADDDSEKLLDNGFKPSKYTAKSSELQQWKLKNNYRHVRRNGFGFPTSLRQLSLVSIQMLFNRLWQLLMISNDGSRSSYAIILIALISGRRVQDVIKELGLDKSQRTWLSYKKGVNGSYHTLDITVNVTTNRRSHLLPHRQSFGREFALPILIEIQSILEQPTFIEQTQIFESLKDLKRQLDLPALSYQHIESALYSIIQNELNKPLHADLITAVDVKHSSPLYYTSISTKSLNNTYVEAVSLMTKMCGTDVQKQLLSNNLSITNKPYIGSDMALNRGICQKFFEQLADAVESFNGRLIRDLSIKQDRYIEQFNAYSIWLWHIIMIQTGIRPVVHAPGLLNQFDFRARLFWVSDKEERQGQSQGRLIPLSQFLITAIQNYIEYIRQFAALHNIIYPSVQFTIDDILNSCQPLIQIFSKNPKGFSGITPSKVRYQLKSFFSHQDNWLRHQLRTLLTNKVPEHLICALYGHEQPDQEAMHPMSSLSINEIKSLSDCLDEVACELNLKQVEVRIHG